MTSLPAKRGRGERADAIERMRDEAATAVLPLPRMQRRFVEAYLELGDARSAADAAGYKKATGASKLLRKPKVHAAVVAALRLREAELTFSRDDAVATLAGAATARLEDFVEQSAEDGAPAKVRDLAALSTGAQSRVKKIHADAAGNLHLELIPITTVIDALAKVAGWTPDSPAFVKNTINIVGVDPAEAAARLERARSVLADELARARGTVLDAEVIEIDAEHA